MISAIQPLTGWMVFHMMTAQNYLDLMKHALGKTPDSRHSLIDDLNRCGRSLVTSMDWRWRLVGPVQLVAKANQDYFNLPEDFGNMVKVYIDQSQQSSGFVRVHPVGLDVIGEYRQLQNVAGGADIYIFFPAYQEQNTEGGEPVARAPTFPTPTTDGNPTISMFYRRIWREIPSDKLDRVPGIPTEFENALVLFSRLTASRIENPDKDYSLLENEYQTELRRLKVEESRRQQEYGSMRGGASSRIWRRTIQDQPHPIGTITF